MNSCKNCDKLQNHSRGTAPTRIKYNQPSMYDHMPTFCCYKHKQDLANQIFSAKKDILQQDKNFTNLQINENNKVDECLSNFGTQSIARFKNEMKLLETLPSNIILKQSGENGDYYFEEPKDDYNEISKNIKLSKSIESLNKISRSPIRCPVSACNETIGITSIFSHFLRDHRQCFSVDFQDIDGDRRSVLMFEEEIFNFGENICLGVLVYGGRDSTEDNRPGVIGVCRPNSFLSEKYSHFANHLPILIMGCRTSLASLFTDQPMELKPKDNSKSIIVFWFAAIETTKTIFATITVFNLEMTSSRSSIIKVRNLKYSQTPTDFLNSETNYLMLTNGDVDILSNNGKSKIEMEIFIHEFDE